MIFAQRFYFHRILHPSLSVFLARSVKKSVKQNPRSYARSEVGGLSEVRSHSLVSVCELRSSFGASSLENFSAVCGSHSFSETVLFLSLSLLRLICSYHLGTSFCLSEYFFLKSCGIAVFPRRHGQNPLGLTTGESSRPE